MLPKIMAFADDFAAKTWSAAQAQVEQDRKDGFPVYELNSPNSGNTLKISSDELNAKKK